MARNTLILISICLGIVLVVFVVAVWQLKSPDVAAAVGAVATAVGTLAGLALGKSAGEAGKAELQRLADRYLAVLEGRLTDDDKVALRAFEARRAGE